MATIAYVDHSYHKKTFSTRFIRDVLEAQGHQVDLFWDDAWQGGNEISFEQVMNYDVVIMFQSFCQLEEGKSFGKLHPNVVYIPMLDQFGVRTGAVQGLNQFWRKFEGCKVVNFSLIAHGLTVGAGIRSKLFRFYRQPEQKTMVTGGLHGFLWIRLQQCISWQVVKKLIGETHFDSFHLHLAKDPGSTEIELPSEEDIKKYNITVTTWFDSKSEFEEVLNKANVYFAPRLEEGIGQSFLEAFARGQCVVAPNHGTMNEYIQHGFTGLLYDDQSPQPLDFTQVEDICARTHQACRVGYEQWINSQTALVEYILMPNEEAYRGLGRWFVDKETTSKCTLKFALIQLLKQKLGSVRLVRRVYHLFTK